MKTNIGIKMKMVSYVNSADQLMNDDDQAQSRAMTVVSVDYVVRTLGTVRVIMSDRHLMRTINTKTERVPVVKTMIMAMPSSGDNDHTDFGDDGTWYINANSYRR